MQDALDVLGRYDRQPAIPRDGPARKVEGMWEALGACERAIWRVARLGLHERPALSQHPAILALKVWGGMRQRLGMGDWLRRARVGHSPLQERPFSSEQLKLSLAITETLARSQGLRDAQKRLTARGVIPRMTRQSFREKCMTLEVIARRIIQPRTLKGKAAQAFLRRARSVEKWAPLGSKGPG